MDNAEYWRGRFAILDDAAHKQGDAYLRSLEGIYNDAAISVKKEIEAWYGRFAQNNQISLSDAKKLLTNGQLEEFRWTVDQYIKAGEQANLSAEWMRKLENASARYHISRLEAVQMQIQQQIELLYGNRVDELDHLFRDMVSNGYTYGAFELQRGLGVGWDFTALNQKKLEALLSKPWTTDGKTFSDRCWHSKNTLIDAVHRELIQGMLRGDPPSRIVTAIQKQFWTDRYKAHRLVHTETTYFNAVARNQMYQDFDVEQIEIVETLDSHTCTVCQPLDGTVIPASQHEPGVTVPPYHPNCRGTTCPYYDDMEGERAARTADGDVYYVPADMKYEDWKKAFVDGGTKDGLTVATADAIIELTQDEQWALNEYISSGSYKINEPLRTGGSLSNEQEKLIENLDAALGKMPLYQGLVYRSMDSSMILDIDDFWAKHAIGQKISYSAYTSSATKIYDDSMDIQIIMKSRTGRDIRQYNSDEFEILFSRNSSFVVVDRKENTIWMEQIE